MYPALGTSFTDYGILFAGNLEQKKAIIFNVYINLMSEIRASLNIYNRDVM